MTTKTYPKPNDCGVYSWQDCDCIKYKSKTNHLIYAEIRLVEIAEDNWASGNSINFPRNGMGGPCSKGKNIITTREEALFREIKYLRDFCKKLTDENSDEVQKVLDWLDSFNQMTLF